MTQTNRYLCCLVALGAFSLLTPLRLVQVTGASMEPTLHNHDRYLLDRFYYRFGGIQYDDVVVLSHDGGEIIKRVKGLPGDHLQMYVLSDGGRMPVVNLTRHPEARRRDPVWANEVVVPPNTLYVVGDNLIVSEDSRRFGPAPDTELVGLVRDWNLSRSFSEPVRDVGRQPRSPQAGGTTYAETYAAHPGEKYRQRAPRVRSSHP